MKKLLISAIIAAVSMGSAQAADGKCHLNIKGTNPGWEADTVSETMLMDSTIKEQRDKGAKRYEGYCALKVKSGQKPTVKFAPIAHGFFRFYAYIPAGAKDLKIFSASGAMGEIASAVVTGNKLTINGKTTDFKAGFWHMVEVNVTAKGAVKAVVDAKPVITDAVALGTDEKIEKFSLGSLSGTQVGDLYFDSVVASNDKPVGNKAVKLPNATGDKAKLYAGDSDGDGKISSNDASKTMLYFLDPKPENAPKGTPDCDLDGKVTSNDASCSMLIFLEPTNKKDF